MVHFANFACTVFSEVRHSPGLMLSSVLIYTAGSSPPYVRTREDPSNGVPLSQRRPPVGPGRYAACARMGSWNIETPSSGPRKPKHGWKPLVESPRKSGGVCARTPQGKPSPASLSNCACNRLKKPTITRTGAYCCWGSRPYKTGTIGYSTKCVEGEFCELRHN